MFEVGQKVKRKNTDLAEKYDFLNSEAIKVLQGCNFIGTIDQIQDDLYYVGFKHDGAWVTQVFKEDELELVQLAKKNGVEYRTWLVDENKYNIKSPYAMKAKKITVHNTDNEMSAHNEISYMRNNNNETSYHIAVDEKEAVQGLPFNRNGWHCGGNALYTSDSVLELL